FVISATLLGLYLFVLNLLLLLDYTSTHSISFGAAMAHHRVPSFLFAFGIFGALYPFALSAYHVFLIFRGETTREYLQSHKYPKNQRHRPYTQASWWKNFVIVLGRPRGPTY